MKEKRRGEEKGASEENEKGVERPSNWRDFCKNSRFWRHSSGKSIEFQTQKRGDSVAVIRLKKKCGFFES